jgi:hypothetical protein
MTIYYVYAYLRASNGTPYYIGKGKNSRVVGKHPGISVPKDRSKIIFIEKNLTNVGACAIERRLIRWYGRKDLGTGILLNRTHGGDGGKGGSPKGRTFSESMRKKLSEAGKGRKLSEETRQKISRSRTGKKRAPFSQEWKDKISSSNKGKIGKPKTEEQKQHLSELNSKPVYCITNDTWYPSRRVACKELNLKYGNVGHCLQGYQKSTKGFRFSYHS